MGSGGCVWWELFVGGVKYAGGNLGFGEDLAARWSGLAGK